MKPTVPVEWIFNELGFDSLDECTKYLKEINAIVENGHVNIKESLPGLRLYLSQE